jgi:hypothetical protein
MLCSVARDAFNVFLSLDETLLVNNVSDNDYQRLISLAFSRLLDNLQLANEEYLRCKLLGSLTACCSIRVDLEGQVTSRLKLHKFQADVFADLQDLNQRQRQVQQHRRGRDEDEYLPALNLVEVMMASFLLQDDQEMNPTVQKADWLLEFASVTEEAMGFQFDLSWSDLSMIFPFPNPYLRCMQRGEGRKTNHRNISQWSSPRPSG